jgi:phosphatidylglycerophosphate synthase
MDGYSIMTTGDGSRDRRIEDPTNFWLIHPLARALLPAALRLHISANAASLLGLVSGAVAALAYSQFHSPALLALGLAASATWLVFDGLDGIIARATGTSSRIGRMLDGWCDHTVFFFIYLSLALAIDTPEGWILAWTAGGAHAVQSALYEGDRERFHRRVAARGREAPLQSRVPAVWLHTRVAHLFDRWGMRLDRLIETSGERQAIAAAYAQRASRPMRLMIPLTANMRVWAIFAACALGNPVLFWWFELVPLSLVALAGLAWHRKVEADLTHRFGQGGSVALEPAVQSRIGPKDYSR